MSESLLAQDSTLPFSEAEVEESGTAMVLAFHLGQTEALPFSEAEVEESGTPMVPAFHLGQTEALQFSEAEVEESAQVTEASRPSCQSSPCGRKASRPPC